MMGVRPKGKIIRYSVGGNEGENRAKTTFRRTWRDIMKGSNISKDAVRSEGNHVESVPTRELKRMSRYKEWR